ncbi:DUF433 domain-containing protein [Euzebya pacifica]|uniref:DUF433 domain-containing protein n=1 Tax=Euzebya pacifica TaxID=1608957 RepID=UPI003CCC88A3
MEVNPDRLSGSPVIAGTRSPADDVARLAATDDGEAILRADYGQTDEQIADARTWWAAVTGYAPACGLTSQGHRATVGDRREPGLAHRDRAGSTDPLWGSL